MTTADPQRSSPGSLDSRLDFERLIADISSKFIGLRPGELDREIEAALGRVCELLRIDLAVLWQWSSVEPELIRPTHVYSAEALPGPVEPMRQEQYPWAREQVKAGRLICLPRVEELPAGAAVDLETCRQFGIQSVLCLPLLVGGGAPIGALGFNAIRAQRDWPRALVNRLQLIAEVFTNALARRRYELELQESEARSSLAADSADAGLWTLEFGSGHFWASEKARALFGFSPDELITLERFEARVHPDDRARVRDALDESARLGAPLDLEYRIAHQREGGERWIASRGRAHRGEDGGLERLMGISTDVTERRLAERIFRRSEARLASGAELAGLAYYEVDFREGNAYFDERLLRICGMESDEEREPGLRPLEVWVEQLHPEDRARILEVRRQLHGGELEQVSLQYRFLHPVEGERWVHHLARVAQRDANGHALVTYGVLRDITERKRAEDELGDLGRRLIRAHEEERALLARELHDDLTQRLAVLAIDVGRAELAAPDPSQAAVLGAVREGLVRLSEDVHALAYQLHPSVLEELGLVEALRAECERVQHKLAVEIAIDPGARSAVVGKDVALCLFRVAQEALNNAARHAQARAAEVFLREMDGGLLLMVRDEGVGFDPASPKKGKHLGLASMRERVRLLEGTLDIESAPGQGTAIVAWVPMRAGPE